MRGLDKKNNAKELFYTLENIQVYCIGLKQNQIKEMADIFEKYGYKIWDDDCALDVDDFNYLLEFTGREVFVSVGSEEKTTITYEKFMELFGIKEENKDLAEETSIYDDMYSLIEKGKQQGLKVVVTFEKL